MANIIFKGVKKVLKKGGKAVAEMIAPDVLNLGAKLGSDLVEKQKNLVKIPDLKDVHIDEALRILKDELKLIPTPVIAKPGLGYADESENEVMYSVPRFGSRVNPRTTVKVYYLTQEVVDKSKKLLGSKPKQIKVPVVIGLNIYEAREDLEGLGLKVAEKLEKSGLKFFDKEEGQVTRITSPNNRKIGAKAKTGDRVWVYYVNEEVILKSRSMKEAKEKGRQEKINSIGKAAKDVPKGIFEGVVVAPKKIAKTIRKPFAKKKREDQQLN